MGFGLVLCRIGSSFLPLIFLLLLGIGIQAPLDAAESSQTPIAFCRRSFQAIPALSLRSSFSEIAQEYRDLSAKGGTSEHDPVEHLYSAADWKKNAKRRKAGLEPLYGASTEEDYLKAAHWVQGLPKETRVSTELLQKIHSMACERTFFQGFELRRIRGEFKTGLIGQDQYKALYHRIFKEHAAFSGIDHRTLAGSFRVLPEDRIPFSGFNVAADAFRKYSPKQWKQIQENRYLEVEKVDRILPDGTVLATVNYTSPSQVAVAVNTVLMEVENALSRAESLDEKVQAIVRMERDLISIHPFHDGNGRSIRLLRDLLYRRIGLPPPLHSFVEDLNISEKELLEIERAEMVRFLTK